jgi:hypothetical protein
MHDMKIPRLSTRQLMALVAIAALVSFLVTETWRRRRYKQCMALAAMHARDQAYLLTQARKWQSAVGLTRETVKFPDITTGRILKVDEQATHIKILPIFYKLQAEYHGRESRVFQRAAERPWEPLPARSSYYPDLKRLYQQAARMK